MGVNTYKGRKYRQNNSLLVEDNLVIEASLEILLNKNPFTLTMRTPGNDLDLIRGLLFTEDIYVDKKVAPILQLTDENDMGYPSKIDLNIDETKLKSGYQNSRNFLSVSSCGICGKTELNHPEGVLRSEVIFSSGVIPELFEKMRERQITFSNSGGSHAAAAFDKNGYIISLMEDIGRHNAVDKVIGNLLNNQLLKEAQILTVSGRVSYEIIIKTFKAGIPILAAVSAPSTLAVDFAKELGITLLGFCRGEKFTCYSHPQRIE